MRYHLPWNTKHALKVIRREVMNPWGHGPWPLLKTKKNCPYCHFFSYLAYFLCFKETIRSITFQFECYLYYLNKEYVHWKDTNKQKAHILKTVTHHGHMTWAEWVKDELMQDATCFLVFTHESMNVIEDFETPGKKGDKIHFFSIDEQQNSRFHYRKSLG